MENDVKPHSESSIFAGLTRFDLVVAVIIFAIIGGSLTFYAVLSFTGTGDSLSAGAIETTDGNFTRYIYVNDVLRLNGTAGFTVSRLLGTDASGVFASVTDLTGYIAGTTNQVTVTDDADGTLTLSLPQSIHTGATPTFATLSTGQGQYELYAMDQDVETTDAVTFVTVDTGQGANELYDMDQNVLTSSSPTFVGMTLSPGAARTIQVGPNTATVGDQLTVAAGRALSGGTDLAGGTLVLASGVGTGAGGSYISLQVSKAGGAGSADNAVFQAGSIDGTSHSWYPHGTSAGNTYETRWLELAAGGTNYVGFKAPDAITTNQIYTLPSAVGAAGASLTDAGGDGTLSWVTHLPLAGGTMAGSVDFGNNAATNVGAAGNDFGATNTLVATDFSGNVTIAGNYLHFSSVYIADSIGPSDLELRRTSDELLQSLGTNMVYLSNAGGLKVDSTGVGDHVRLYAYDTGGVAYEAVMFVNNGNPPTIVFANLGSIDFGSIATNNLGAAGNDFGASNTLVATQFSGDITRATNNTGAVGADAVRWANGWFTTVTAKSSVTGAVYETEFKPLANEVFTQGDVVTLFNATHYTKSAGVGDYPLGVVDVNPQQTTLGYETTWNGIGEEIPVMETTWVYNTITDANGNTWITKEESQTPVMEWVIEYQERTLENGEVVLLPFNVSKPVYAIDYVGVPVETPVYGPDGSLLLCIWGPRPVKIAEPVVKGDILIAGPNGMAVPLRTHLDEISDSMGSKSVNWKNAGELIYLYKGLELGEALENSNGPTVLVKVTP